MSIGIAGIGSTQHFSMELMQSMTGTDLVHVPYKGGSLALSDVLAGQVPAAITGLPTALASIRAGQVRALAVTAPERSRHMPELPTLAEAGLPGDAVAPCTGLCAPAGTPAALVERLNADVKRALAMPQVRQQLLDASVPPSHLPAARMAELIASEVGRFSRIVAAAGIVPEN
jgi:tripartite-type tricarboxylate transporter receptor subunit TctC